MRYLLVFALMGLFFNHCTSPKTPEPAADTAAFKKLLNDYYLERLHFFPLDAAMQGIEGYNDQLPLDITDAFRSDLQSFYTKYQKSLGAFNTSGWSDNDRISFDILQWECELGLQGLQFPDNYLSINQFYSLPLTLGQYGSGSGPQPFKTVADYDNWLKRIGHFPQWADSAMVYMRTGMSKGYVLPAILVKRIIPQMKDLVVADPAKSLFYGPVTMFPDSFSAADKSRLTAAYIQAIQTQLTPSFQKLADFFEKEYLPNARETHGISVIPGGRERYNYLIKYWTTTNMTADDIFALGEKEVARIRSEMEKVKEQVGFKGDLRAFFDFVRADPQFRPFKQPEEVLAWYAALEGRMAPQLKSMFDLKPKSKFEVRRTEAFREASASPEYIQGTPDGTRPGVFYMPVPDVKAANVVGGEALFLHEAIPGHHYQCSLQQENEDLPALRRFLWYGAYGEGWALYAESLGKELGLYTDPYQYFGMLSSEMHRAIRLVVDVGIHAKGWTREQAIEYSKNNEAEPEESIISEIERYMGIPGQALSYKIGQLKIIELRQKAQQKMGDKFDIRGFHNQMLDAGCLPIQVLEAKLDRWMK